MKKVRRATRDYINDAQCCYRTMQCDTKRLHKEPRTPCRQFPNYTPEG
jgi:hypothetical protein